MSPLRCSYLNGRTLHFQLGQDNLPVRQGLLSSAPCSNPNYATAEAVNWNRIREPLLLVIVKQVGQQPNDVLHDVRRRNQDDAQVAFFIYSEFTPSFRQTTAGALRSAPDPARRSIHPPPTSAARSTRPWAAVPGRSGSATSLILGCLPSSRCDTISPQRFSFLRFSPPDSIRTGPENRRSKPPMEIGTPSFTGASRIRLWLA